MASRHTQRVSAIICLYIYFFKPQDIELIAHDLMQFKLDENKESPYDVSPSSLNMMIDALDHQDLVIHKINELLTPGWTFDRLGLMEQAILFYAISEIVYQEDSKAIIIDEAIKITKEYGDQDSYKLVNAILDKL